MEQGLRNEVRPPPYAINAHDKRGLVVIVTAVALSFVVACFLMRVWLRLRAKEWKGDDYMLFAATIFHIIQAGLTFHIVNEGFGKSTRLTSQLDLDRIGKDDFVSHILYIVTLFLSKCAILLLYLRLSPYRGHAVAAWTTIAVSSAWAIVSVVLIALPCHPLTFWRTGPDQCINIWLRWQVIATTDIITEVTIFCISIYLVAQLNMKRQTKAIVIVAFSARLPVIAAASFRLFYLHILLASTDPNLDAAYVVVATQWHSAYAVMSTVITGLGPFLRPYSKSPSASYPHSSNARRRSGHASSMLSLRTKSRRPTARPESYALQTMQAHESSISLVERSQRHDSSVLDGPRSPPLVLRPDAFRRKTNVTGGNTTSDGGQQDAGSRRGHESRQWSITKKTELTVETRRASFQ